MFYFYSIGIYYMRALSRARGQIIKVLQKQIKSEGKDKSFLIKMTQERGGLTD